MYSYASRVAVDDRWRIAAYIRALQASQTPTPQQAAAARPGTCGQPTRRREVNNEHRISQTSLASGA